jgi:hypothetical protein
MFTVPMTDFEPTLTPISFDPNSLATPTVPYPKPNLGPYLTAAGGAFDAMSQYTAGKQSAALLRANAGIAGLQAQGELQAGAEQAELYQQHLNAALGRQAANTGGSGLTTSGSPLRALESTAYLGAAGRPWTDSVDGRNAQCRGSKPRDPSRACANEHQWSELRIRSVWREPISLYRF